MMLTNAALAQMLAGQVLDTRQYKTVLDMHAMSEQLTVPHPHSQLYKVWNVLVQQCKNFFGEAASDRTRT
jgi:hypothetical protein